MKEMLKVFEKDYREEDFTKEEKIVYGIIAPAVLIIITILGSWLEVVAMK
jgi:flagellar biosynthesis/type III secretory pathway M-ring protein FliF/YscJ